MLRTLSILLLLILIPSFALASPKSDAAKQYAEGIRLFSEKNYKGASAALEQAYEMDKSLRTLFAWAQSERLSGHCKRSRELFAEYIAEGANDKQSRTAFEMMKSCEPSGEEETVTSPDEPPLTVTQAPPAAVVVVPEPVVAAPVPVPPTAPHEDLWYKDWIGVSLISTGVAGLALGGYFYATALNTEEHDNDITLEDYVALGEEATAERKIAVLAGGTGMFLLGGAVAYYLLKSTPASSVGATIAPNKTTLTYSFSF